MNIAAPSIENAGPFTRACVWHKLLANKLVEVAEKIKKLGQDDPRRIVHSLKVGLALTLVSLFYYIQPLYDRIGENLIWAVMTVVLVFEFSVGKLGTYLITTIYKPIFYGIIASELELTIGNVFLFDFFPIFYRSNSGKRLKQDASNVFIWCSRFWSSLPSNFGW